MILPMLARDEEAQPTTQESMFSFVRLSDDGPRRHDGPRSEVETIARIARGDEGPIDWHSMLEHRTIHQAIAAVVPGYEKLGRIDATKQEFHIAGRSFHQPRFATSSGRAKWNVVSLPTLDIVGAERRSSGQRGAAEDDKTAATSKHNRLRLMTIRSEGQFNTVVYEEEDIYRHQNRRDVILISAADMDRLGLAIDQCVTVESCVGRMENILVRQAPIRAGNTAMYYPQANTLVPAIADPESKTPAYKAVSITIAI